MSVSTSSLVRTKGTDPFFKKERLSRSVSDAIEEANHYDVDDSEDYSTDEDSVDGFIDESLLTNKPKSETFFSLANPIVHSIFVTGTNWKQQRLEAWEPILTPLTVLPSLLCFGLIMVPVGILLLKTSHSVQEFQFEYTDCNQICKDYKCRCSIDFELEEPFSSDVYLYYVLENYYQANRRFAGSWDESQIKGLYYEAVDVSCYPYDYEKINGTAKPIAPCGVIANAMFNDTFLLNPQIPELSSRNLVKAKINTTQIAWATDQAYKFRNPKDESIWTEKWAKPPNWAVPANQLDPLHPENNGFLNEGFLVWMRAGAFTTTRKLYGRVFADREDNGTYVEGLPPGNYTMVIDYSELVLCTTSEFFLSYR